MKIIRYIFLLMLASLGISQWSQAQVTGISYTLAPGANYTWYNEQSGLDNAFMVGGKVGIGFGELLELRGLYYQTVDQEINFAGLNIDTEDFDDRDVELARYGAELKMNLSRGSFLPYLLLGGGIQDIGRQGLDESENIYGTVGLGLTLGASDRVVFSVEGQYLAYQYDAVRNLLTQEERDDLGNQLSQTLDLGNWSVGANVAFYIGGREPGSLSETDRAYLRQFGNGMSGMSVPLEINLARVEWDDGMPFRDTWLGGGGIGLDFGPFVGIRGYYLQSMKDDEVQLDFDELAMYGADLRLNLSRAGLGFTPYLTLGGGRIDVSDDYVGLDGQQASDRAFATGGGGISLNLGRVVNINGSYKVLLSSSEDFEDISSTSQLSNSNMYTIGLNLALGGAADGERVVQERIEMRLDEQEQTYEQKLVEQKQNLNQKYEEKLSAKDEKMKAELAKEQERIDELKAQNERNAKQLKQRYQAKIADLEKRLNEAYQEEDIDKAALIKREKEIAEEVVAELESRERAQIQMDMNRRQRVHDSIQMYYPIPGERLGRRDAGQQKDQEARLSVEDWIKINDAINKQNESIMQRYMQLYPRSTQNQNNEQLLNEMRRMNEAYRQNQQQPNSTEMQQRERAYQRQMEALQSQIDELQRKRQASQNEEEQQRYNELLKSLEELQQSINQPDNSTGYTNDGRNTDMDAMSDMKVQIMKLQETIDAQNERIAEMQQGNYDTDIDVNTEVEEADESDEKDVVTRNDISIERSGDYLADEDSESGFSQHVKYTGMSGFAGLNLGDNDNNTFNIGLRWHYKLGRRENFELMPEAFFGFGSPTNFGLFVNGLYPIDIKNTLVQPYVGTGFGFMQLADDNPTDENPDASEFKPAFNLILGTYLEVAGGRLYVDLTGRNLFKNSQLVAGYRFAF